MQPRLAINSQSTYFMGPCHHVWHVCTVLTHKFLRLLYSINIKCRNPQPSLHNLPYPITNTSQCFRGTHTFLAVVLCPQHPREGHRVPSSASVVLFLNKVSSPFASDLPNLHFQVPGWLRGQEDHHRVSVPTTWLPTGDTNAHCLFKSFRQASSSSWV